MLPLYYEGHVTVSPVFGEKLEEFKLLCRARGFRAADLLMQKRAEDTPERSRKDTFATGHSKNYTALRVAQRGLVDDLRAKGFAVWRTKIEAVIEDEKFARASA